jgi:hypothetical protein
LHLLRPNRRASQQGNAEKRDYATGYLLSFHDYIPSI